MNHDDSRVTASADQATRGRRLRQVVPLLALGTIVGLSAVLLNARRNRAGEQPTAPPEPPVHLYRYAISGTDGVRLRMLAIHEPPEGGPPERHEEIVVVPTKYDLAARNCWAWFDTLPDGASGKNGDVWKITLQKNHMICSEVEATIRGTMSQSRAIGDRDGRAGQ